MYEVHALKKVAILLSISFTGDIAFIFGSNIIFWNIDKSLDDNRAIFRQHKYNLRYKINFEGYSNKFGNFFRDASE